MSNLIDSDREVAVNHPKYGKMTFKNIDEAIEFFNIDKRAYNYRVDRGMNPYKALMDILNTRNRKNFKTDNATTPWGKMGYKSLEDALVKLGSNMEIYKTILKSGFSPDDALKHIEMLHKQSIGNQVIKSSTNSLIEELENISEHDKSEDNKPVKQILFLGKLYKSFKDICKQFEVPDHYWYSRVRAGIEPEAAVCEPGKLSKYKIDSYGVAWYKVEWSEHPVTTYSIILKNHPDLVLAYERFNPTSKYRPFNDSYYVVGTPEIYTDSINDINTSNTIIDTMYNKSNKDKKYKIFGKEFNSYEKLCGYFGISTSKGIFDYIINDRDFDIEIKMMLCVEKLYKLEPRLELEFVGLNNIGYYSIAPENGRLKENNKEFYTALDIIRKYSPKWEKLYIKYNKDGIYHRF